ncbi:LacI family DNA-binding transcriptional regulator [Microvirga mediterraneensis]|uniref:LacI family DNA-binding transcriptional regulator n=1 Tax=Microvirga mediterraneensis TaxID=2754695 RepID=UPI0031B56D31
MRIEEVARIAGVSPITVSRALHQPGRVSEEKRLKVQQAVEVTGYASNPHARALRSGRSNIVAAFVSNIVSQQFGLAVQGCAEVLEPRGFQLMIGQTSYSYARETSMIQSLLALRPAAVLFTGVVELEENRSFLRELGVPVIETWAFPPDPIDMLVGFSNTDGGRMVAQHFAAQGYRRVAFIGRSGGRGLLRLAGFRDGVRSAGLKLVAELSLDTVSGLSDGQRALNQLLDSHEKIDAVFCANDLIAMGALLEASRRGLNMPGDIAIAGFGDSDLAAEIPPGLTTIRMDCRQIGRRAGEMLLARLNGETDGSSSETVALELVKRGST